jgi:hypothetical protein
MKKKLNFKKETITNLSKSDLSGVLGGNAAVTTSIGSCTGFLCCVPISAIYTQCFSDDNPQRPDCLSQDQCNPPPPTI